MQARASAAARSSRSVAQGHGHRRLLQTPRLLRWIFDDSTCAALRFSQNHGILATRVFCDSPPRPSPANNTRTAVLDAEDTAYLLLQQLSIYSALSEGAATF